MNFGQRLGEAFGSVPETSVHPHVLGERAEHYHSLDGWSTELETLTILNAIVYAFKPTLVIETGTYRGFGSIAIADALKANGFGMLVTIDIDSHRIIEAKSNIVEFDPGLMSFIKFVTADSRVFVVEYDGEPFEAGFFDSELAQRHFEFQTLVDRGKLTTGSPCLFHDTSSLRSEYMQSEDVLGPQVLLREAAKTRETLECPNSRGFRIIKV